MSVDSDIREGLVMLDQRLPAPDTHTAYEEIVREARTQTRRSRLLQGGLVAAAIVAVVATSRLDGTAPDPDPVSTPVDEPSVSAISVAGLDGWEDLAGTWTARNVSFASMTAHLKSLGVAGAADELRMALPRAFAEGVDLSLEFHLGRAVLRYDGHELDTQNYSVEDGATLYLRPLVAPGGRSRFAARIEGERLWLEFLDTTVPSHGGISEKVLLTALNTSAPFERVVP